MIDAVSSTQSINPVMVAGARDMVCTTYRYYTIELSGINEFELQNSLRLRGLPGTSTSISHAR